MAGGRPQKEIDWKLLDALIVWASQEYCAEQLDMHIGTLAEKIKTKYQLSFPQYKHKRQESLRINLLKKQYDVAMQGNVSMLIWLGKQHLEQSDKQVVDNKSSDRSMSPSKSDIDYRKLSTEELKTLEAIMVKAQTNEESQQG